MFPRSLLGEDLTSRAEGKVFEALRDGLDDEWEVFHSASVMYRDPALGARDDEGDFVLCHPSTGIVSLEVKGGGIECRYGEWFRLDHGGARERTRDPFKQALDHRYSLERRSRTPARRETSFSCTRSRSRTSRRTSWSWRRTRRGDPDRPQRLKDIGAAIDRALAYHRGARDTRIAPGPDGAAMLRELLAPHVRIEVPLATTLEDEERQLVELTHEQTALLRRFRRDRRMVVTGCAGSGKTMLAVERGRELAAGGRRVLFVCFNRALAKHLRDASTGLEVFTFHALCTHWAHRAGVSLPKYDDDPPQEYWDAVLPDAFVEAIDRAGGQYDEILVDEAQDLSSDWLDALTFTLRDEDAARSGSSWTTTSASTTPARRPVRVPPVRPDRQLPQHPGDPPRGDEALRGHDGTRGGGTGGP